MSRIYKLLRKTDEERAGTEPAADKESRENMDISEIKRKILEKIEKEKAGSSGKEKAALSILSEKLGVATADSQVTGVTVSAESPSAGAPKAERPAEKEYSEKLALAGSENENLKALHENALKRNEEMALQLKEKAAVIAELERKLTDEFEEIRKEKEKAVSSVDTLISRVYSTGKEAKERASRISQLEEALKAKEKKLAETDRLCKQLENINNENETKARSYEKEAKDLQERAAQLTQEIEAKSGKIEESSAQYRELDATLKDSALRLDVMEQEKKDTGEKLSRFMAELADVKRRLAETEDAYNAAETEKGKAELKLGSLARANKELEEKVSQLTDELDAGTKRLSEAERVNGEIDDIAKEASFKLHSVEKEKKELEEKAASLSVELETTVKRHDSEKAIVRENINKLRAEIDIAKHIIKEKEKDEISLREAVSQAASGLDLRDKKIEADMKYYEKLIKEMKELKQEVRMLISKRDNPGA